MTRHFLTALTFLFLATSIRAGEGMWLPFLLNALNESEMKSLGMKMSADDIYSVNHGSLKDAVVHFGGFCTGEVVSDQGLVFTNHHCGYDAIQNHSTVEHNYLQEGYWAKTFQEEKPTPGLFVTFIVSIEDVTQAVLEGVDPKAALKDQQAAIDRNLATVKTKALREAWQDVFVRAFYEGNQYYLFTTETYRDVRYVGSPPESIGKFGADTDNWVWPRHTGDFSVFRIYAGPDNKPADYSPLNKPFKPKYFFPVSLDGVREGDFTLVFGFPGKTNEYLPSYAIGQTAKLVDPARIDVRNISLGIMDDHMRKDEAVRLAYAVKYAGLANSWKKWIGEVKGLQLKKVTSIKEKQEADFTERLMRHPELQSEFGNILPAMKSIYTEMDKIVRTRTILGEVLNGANLEVFKIAGLADRFVKAFKENGEKGFKELAEKNKALLSDFYAEYRTDIDQEIYDGLMAYVVSSLPAEDVPAILLTSASPSFSVKAQPVRAKEVYDHSALPSGLQLQSLIELGGEAFAKKMETDKAYQVYIAMKQVMDNKISPQFNKLNDELTLLQKSYMKAQMVVYPEKKFWPDANSTLRVAYGQVEPYAPRDGMAYKTQTYLDGVMEKYVPGDYEFDVSPKLIALYNAKDYGPYGEDGKMPVCFIASNHTTGGNSGSPALDAEGNLIGINFDRVWEGTMSDLYYDRSICRNIMVDIRYVLFVMDKFAGATNLIQELKLVHPKAAMSSPPKTKKKSKAKS